MKPDLACKALSVASGPCRSPLLDNILQLTAKFLSFQDLCPYCSLCLGCPSLLSWGCLPLLLLVLSFSIDQHILWHIVGTQETISFQCYGFSSCSLSWPILPWNFLPRDQICFSHESNLFCDMILCTPIFLSTPKALTFPRLRTCPPISLSPSSPNGSVLSLPKHLLKSSYVSGGWRCQGNSQYLGWLKSHRLKTQAALGVPRNCSGLFFSCF